MANTRSEIVPSSEVVLIGGGNGHVEVVHNYQSLKTKPFRLTLINESAMAPYSGMLPGMIAGPRNE